MNEVASLSLSGISKDLIFMDRGGVDSAPWRPALVSVKRSASYLNVSRCLVRWMKQVRLSRTRLCMRYVKIAKIQAAALGIETTRHDSLEFKAQYITQSLVFITWH